MISQTFQVYTHTMDKMREKLSDRCVQSIWYHDQELFSNQKYEDGLIKLLEDYM